MKVELSEIIALIETKTSWGKEQLKDAILKMLCDKNMGEVIDERRT